MKKLKRMLDDWKLNNTILMVLLALRVLASAFEHDWDLLIVAAVALLINYSYREYRLRTQRELEALHSVAQQSLRVIDALRADPRYQAD